MLRRFFGAKGGNFTITLALTMVPICITAGVAVDYSMASRYKTRLQASIDSATLAAGTELSKMSDGQIKVLVNEYLQANLDPRDYGQIKGQPDVVIDRDKLAVRVDVKAEMPSAFASLIGIPKIEYAGTASIQSGWGGLEAVLVLDNTGSMGAENRLVNLKSAANGFLDEMMGLNTGDDKVKVGIVPFASYVNVGTGNAGASWLQMPPPGQNWNGCVGSRSGNLALTDGSYSTRVPALGNTSCPSAITPLSSNKGFLKGRIQSMNAAGMTYIPAGLMWGLRTISDQAPFSEGVSDVVAKRDRIIKSIILMTDGENTVSRNQGNAFHNVRNNTDANQMTIAACNEIKAKGIRLFTVTFGTSVPVSTKNLIRACASQPADYFDAPSGAALAEVFKEVGKTLTRLYLTQ